MKDEPMYISRVSLKRDAGSTGALAALLTALPEAHNAHKLVWSLFGDRRGRTRDFLYRIQSERGPGHFLIVSAQRPEDRHDLWRIETKDYAPSLVVGERLGFSLRANPAIRSRKGAAEGKGAGRRHDVVMNLKRPKSERPADDRPDPALIFIAGFRWLADRIERNGFTVAEHECRVAGYIQHVVPRAPDRRPIRFTSLDFDGALTVTDPAHLRRALFRGIGPAKAFGCGLLLVRRI